MVTPVCWMGFFVDCVCHSSRLQELGTPKFVQSLHAKKAPDCYLRYVELHEHPLVWEQRLDNESVLKEYRVRNFFFVS